LFGTNFDPQKLGGEGEKRKRRGGDKDFPGTPLIGIPDALGMGETQMSPIKPMLSPRVALKRL
jgi:hypothetical protein